MFLCHLFILAGNDGTKEEANEPPGNIIYYIVANYSDLSLELQVVVVSVSQRKRQINRRVIIIFWQIIPITHFVKIKLPDYNKIQARNESCESFAMKKL